MIQTQTWEGSTDTTLGCAWGAGRVSEYTTSAPAEAAAPAVVESLAASAAALLKLPSSGCSANWQDSMCLSSSTMGSYTLSVRQEGKILVHGERCRIQIERCAYMAWM